MQVQRTGGKQFSQLRIMRDSSGEATNYFVRFGVNTELHVIIFLFWDYNAASVCNDETFQSNLDGTANPSMVYLVFLTKISKDLARLSSSLVWSHLATHLALVCPNGPTGGRPIRGTHTPGYPYHRPPVYSCFGAKRRENNTT